MSAASFIAIEWGTARMTARLIAFDGAIIDRVAEDVRLADLDHDGRIGRLRQLRTRWPDAARTIWLAGMIGSPIGIEAVPQFPCPASLAEISAHARRLEVEELSLAILPGLLCTSRFGDHDVLRGEEVAAAGLIRTLAENALLLSVPGMHGKWIELNAHGIERFHTAMTVELFNILADRSILASLMKAAPKDGEAFRSGLSRASEGGALARQLFSARTAVMTDRFSEADATSYLWGILIGADVRENVEAASGRACFVTGADEIAPLFCAAMNHLGIAAELLDNERLSAAGFSGLRQALAARELNV